MPELEEWLKQFPSAIRDEVLATEGATTMVVGPQRVAFGASPAAWIRWMIVNVDLATRAVPPTETVAWLLDLGTRMELSETEVEAVFGMYQTVDTLGFASTDGMSRLVVVGRLRRDVAGLVFAVDENSTVGCFAALERARVPVAFLLFTPGAVEAVLAAGETIHKQIRRLVRKGVRLGLDIRGADVDRALAILGKHVDNLRQISDDAVVAVRFSAAVAAGHSALVNAALEQASISVDLSFACPPAGGEDAKDAAPYLRAGAFQPQPFDLRAPTGRWDARRHVAIVTETVTDDLLPRVAEAGVRRRLLRLTRLLNFARKEAFFKAAEADPLLWQRYDEFFVHSWPQPEPASRARLLDAGALDDARRVRRLLDRAREVARPMSPVSWRVAADRSSFYARRALQRSRVPMSPRQPLAPAPLGGNDRQLTFADGDTFVGVAREEARQRASGSAAAVRAEQIERHAYLREADRGAALRADLVDFVEFLPSDLGRAVELGSGAGRLAVELREAATSYICVDLASSVFEGLRCEGGLSAVVADAHAIPLAGASVDTVIANNSLEHLYEPATALREVARVLGAEGRLFALIPLDALNPDHVLPAHLWKADVKGIGLACAAAGLEIRRLEIVDLYELGIAEAFPSCRGLVAKLEASRAA